MKKHLIREFREFYEQNRCPEASINPMQVFRLAKGLYEAYRDRLTAFAFLSVLYHTLVGIFDRFDPAEYHGKLSIDKHFLN